MRLHYPFGSEGSVYHVCSAAAVSAERRYEDCYESRQYRSLSSGLLFRNSLLA